MKLYLASGYSWRPRLLELKEMLERDGHQVISRWLRFIDRPERGTEAWTKFAKMVAMENYQDLRLTEGLVIDSRGIRETNNGGVHTELGFALARKIPIWLIGKRGNTFHWLPQIALLEDEQALLEDIIKWQQINQQSGRVSAVR